MIPTTLAQVAHATGAVVPPAAADAVVSRVTTDSREVAPGDLFVALVGERHDGHDHAAEAVARGAVAVLADRDLAGVPTVRVEDTVRALGRLAHDLLHRLQGDGSPDVVGITGSVGKTSTKDLLAHVLAASGPTVAPPGSFNNDIGLPSTVLRCDRSTRYLVLELGSRGIGHIARLTEVARPRVGVVLGVGSAHVGEFGSVENIARAKAELVQALPTAGAGGVAVLNGDDAHVRAMAGLTTASVLTYGTGPGLDVRASRITLDPRARPSFRLELDGGHDDVTLQFTGEPAVGHALASVAAAVALGVETEAAVAALRSAAPVSAGRMRVTTTADGVVVIDDSYNASPESVAAALRSVAAMTRPPGARTWAVLGEMRELGASSVTEHRAVGRLVAQLGTDRLVVVGDSAREILQGAVEEGGAGAMVTDAAAAIALLTDELRPGDHVLVKASRAVGLDRVAAALVGEPVGEPS